MLRFLAFITLLSTLNAELVWEKTKLEHNAKLGEKEALYTFSFKNTGHREVKITKLLSSCGCTTAELKKKTIPAQSTASITAKMDLKGISGLKSSTIKVYLNNSNSPSHTLTIKVKVPSPIQVTPSFLNWRKSDARSTKEISIKIHQNFSAKVTKIEYKNQSFQTKLSEAKDKTQSLSITPPSKDTLKNGREKITIHFQTPDGKIIKKNIYLFVY